MKFLYKINFNEISSGVFSKNILFIKILEGKQFPQNTHNSSHSTLFTFLCIASVSWLKSFFLLSTVSLHSLPVEM
jgi:hypothetical protein